MSRRGGLGGSPLARAAGAIGALVLLLLTIPYGTNVSGTITGFDLMPNKNGMIYYALYSYPIDGVTRNGSQSVGSEAYQRLSTDLKDGRKIEVDVRYFALGPLRSSVLPQFESAASKARSLGILAAVWTAVTGVLMYVIWFKVLKRPIVPEPTPTF